MTNPHPIVTVFDVAEARGVQMDIKGRVDASEFERVGLPMLGGCQSCGATIAAYNSHPTRSGYLSCSDCVNPLDGFSTAEEFEEFVKQCEAQMAAEDAERAVIALADLDVLDLQPRHCCLSEPHGFHSANCRGIRS